MSLREWSHRQGEEPSWLIRLEFGLVATLTFGSLVIAVASLVWAAAASAHPGGLAADGCHNDRKNGGRHCHRAQAPQDGSVSQQGGMYTMRIAPRRVLRWQHPSGEGTRDMPDTSIAMEMVSAVNSFHTRAE